MNKFDFKIIYNKVNNLNQTEEAKFVNDIKEKSLTDYENVNQIINKYGSHKVLDVIDKIGNFFTGGTLSETSENKMNSETDTSIFTISNIEKYAQIPTSVTNMSDDYNKNELSDDSIFTGSNKANDFNIDSILNDLSLSEEMHGGNDNNNYIRNLLNFNLF